MKKLKLIAQSISLMMLLQSATLAWEPPIGIPRPSFGIEETYRMYDDPANRNPELTYHQNAEGGYYTHYVDNTHANATDTDNPYGSIALPKLTIPHIQGRYPKTANGIEEGSIIEVHGGPYDYDPDSVPPDGKSVYSDSTSSKPSFIRGVDSPQVHFRMFYLCGQYLVVEGFYFDDTSVYIPRRPNLPNEGGDYIAIRGNTFVGNGEVTGYNAIDIYGVEDKGTSEDISNIVIFNNEISYYGKCMWMDSGDGNDAHGISIRLYSSYVWAVDNHIHHNGGDSFQVGNESSRHTHHIYIGRNVMHDDRENALDIKEAADVIVSQNEMYNYRELGREDDGTIAGAHGAVETGPKNIWWLFNELYNATIKALGASTVEENFIIGNVIHDISGAISPVHSKAISLYNYKGDEKHYCIGNTMYNVEAGIVATVDSSDVTLLIANNIVDSLSDGTGSSWQRHISIDKNPDTLTLDNNLFYQQGTHALMKWDGTDYTLGEIQSSLNKGLNCIEADPLFVDSVNNNVHLQPTSPAIDAGTSSGVVKDVFDRFEQLYGIDIRKDINGGMRPYGAGWDIGAYEWGSTPADPDPGTDTQPEPDAEPDAVIPDADALVVMNNIIKTGNQSALIRCDMKEPGKLTVKIYDSKGKEIINVCDEQRQAGRHAFVWTGLDSSGSTVGSGIYIVHMKSGSYAETKKIAIIK